MATQAVRVNRTAHGSCAISGPDATIELNPVGCKVKLGELYERIEIAADEARGSLTPAPHVPTSP